MTAQDTIDRLSTCENFQSWNFGGVVKATRMRRDVTKATKFGTPILQNSPDDPRWAGEPDKVQWIDPTTDYDCLILRNRMGALCGYVGVPPSHPLHGNDYGRCPEGCDELGCDHTPEGRLQVHGGITFSNFCNPSEEDETICHHPAPGRPDKVFWFGFDCAHAWDLTPGGLHFMGERDVYRDLAYVAAEIESLAVQLKALE